MTNKNTIGSFTTQGPVSFISDTQTVLGSVTNPGAWTLGPASGLTATHMIQGQPTSLSVARVEGNGTAGAYLDITEASFITYSLGVDDGSTTFKIRTNGPSGTTIASATAAGSWTFGSSSGTTTSHTIQGSVVARDTPDVIIKTTTTTSGATPKYPLAVARQNSSLMGLLLGVDNNAEAVIAANNAKIIFGREFSGSFTETGRINDVGAWTFGSSSTTASHSMRIAAADSVVRLRNTDSTVGVRTTRLQLEDYNGAIGDGVIAFQVPDGTLTGSHLLLANTNRTGILISGSNVGSTTAINFVKNMTYAGLQVTSSTSLGGVTVDGAWTFGQANTDTPHNINGYLVVNGKANGDALININATGAGDEAGIAFQVAGSNKWAIGRSPGESPQNFNFYNYTTASKVGYCIETTGEWKLGPGTYGTSTANRELFLGCSSFAASNSQAIASQNTALEITKNAGSGNNSAEADSCIVMNLNVGAATNPGYFWKGYANGGTPTCLVYYNGSFYGNGTYGVVSDVSLKENIVDATPKLEDLMNVKIRNFNFKDSPTQEKHIGVIAQELEEVFPGLVEQDGEGIKRVKSSVLLPIVIKALQEQQAIIEALETRIAALEA